MSLNYEYVLQTALASARADHPRILDYGSGQGQLIALALARNVDIYGADVPGIETNERVRLIVDGRIPFEDNWFDIVVSNQVFEHVANPKPVLEEIHRVLKPGGALIALFPDDAVWFEGHVGLYFVHWLARFPRLARSYLILSHKLGLGYFRGTEDAKSWARKMQHLLATDVFHHAPRDIEAWISDIFGERPTSLAHDWMVFRIAASNRLRRFSRIARHPWLSRPLAFVCRIRAGSVLIVCKKPPSSS